jgi:ABC-type transport system substrate-binding protein
MLMLARRRPRLLVITLGLCILGAACSPAPSPTASPPASPSPSASPAPAFADTIRVALPDCGCGPLGPFDNGTSPVGGDPRAVTINSFVQDALYRWDPHLRPTPSIASSCEPSPNGLTITCQLIQAVFSNGQPLTAADVAFTYRLMAVHTPIDLPLTGEPCVTDVGFGCLSDVLDSAEVVDPRTVAFHLKRPNAQFVALALPGIWIDSEAVVRAAFEDVRSKASLVGAKALQAGADGVAKELATDQPSCQGLLPDASQLVARTGLFLPDRAEYQILNGGAFDACAYAGTLGSELTMAAASLAAKDLTAIALVYPALALGRAPVGAGPYKVTAYKPNDRLELTAVDSYHGGPPQTRHYVFQFYPDEPSAAKAVAGGTADWVELLLRSSDQFPELTDQARVRTGKAPDPDYLSLTYNVRPGQVFSDVRLRRAMEQCIDMEAIAAAATGGNYIVAYGEIPPGFWMYDEALPKPTRDVGAAKREIEASGWQLGSDSVYQKAGRRLAASIYVRTDDTARVKFAQILAIQVKACGIDISVVQGDWGGRLASLFTWPNITPDTKKPFDLNLFGWQSNWDVVTSRFQSDQISRRSQPDGPNSGGFSDPQIDSLIDQIMTTYDVDRRAVLFRQYQELIAQEQPVLFAYYGVRLVAAANGLAGVDGPLDLNQPLWASRPERIVLRVATAP